MPNCRPVASLAPCLAAALLALAPSAALADPDPASVVPPQAPLYFVADLPPAGDQGTAAEAVAGKLVGTSDPREADAKIADALALPTAAPFLGDADRYVDPWVGRRVAFALTGVGSFGEPQGAAIVAARKPDRAAEAVEQLAAASTPAPQERSYRDVAYRLYPGATAVGVVDDFLVKGDESAFHAIVDASQAGGLVDQPAFAGAMTAGAGKLGFGFLDASRLFAGPPAGMGLPALRALAAAAAVAPQPGPVTLTLDAQTDRLTLDATQSGVHSSTSSAEQPTALVGALPGDSWFAEGVPQVGRAFALADQQAGTAAQRTALAMVFAMIRGATGLDPVRDIAPAVGDVALFVRGATSRSVGGGVVVETPDPAAARRLLAKLAPVVERKGLAQGLQVSPVSIAGARGYRVVSRVLISGHPTSLFPGTIDAVVKGQRMVIAYGDAATRAALAPSTTLGESAAYRTARQSLGGTEPEIFLAFGPIASLVASDPTAQEAAVTLRAMNTLAVAETTTAGAQTTRLVLTLK